jgi:hypothetical protein
LLAVEKHECHFEGELILLGTSDINPSLAAMLDQVSDRVTVLIYAPESWADRFDQYGGVRAEAWQHVEIALRDDQWSVCDTSEDQAEAVAAQLAVSSADCAIDEVSIGCPDGRLVPYITRQLAARGVPSHWAAGRSIAESAPFLLLSTFARWVRSQHREDFAALARHPDMLDWLTLQGVPMRWLGELDRYHAKHLASQYGDWRSDSSGFAHLRSAHKILCRLAEPFHRAAMPLDKWPDSIRELLRTLYAGRSLDRDDPDQRTTLSACQMIRGGLDEIAAVPRPVAPTVKGSDAIDLVLATISAESLAGAAEPNAVEILGWLEMALDEAKQTVIAGIHEGTVPRTLTSDQFLPNRLREHLGIDDSAKRYARDAYVLSALISSRNIHIVTGRTTEDGDPLRPSRLLLATSGPSLVQRWKHVLKRLPAPSWGGGIRRRRTAVEAESAAGGPRWRIKGGGSDSLPPPSWGGIKGGGSIENQFQPPQPVHVARPLESIRVSEFKAYLRCPYRYYLNYVLRLEEGSDSSRELDPATFGSVVHEILNRFGNSELKNSQDSDAIKRFLVSELKQIGRSRFGKAALPAVQIQLQQMEYLFGDFAEVQARRAAEGWEIKFVEAPADGAFEFVVDDEPVQVRGRIDRIDRDRETGEWLVLDYKTSSQAKKPRPSHQRDGEWIDLQLPLYRHLAAELGVRNPTLGYFVLPQADEPKILLANWTAADLESADEAARTVVRNIRQQEFWPPADPARYAEPWDDICLVGIQE